MKKATKVYDERAHVSEVMDQVLNEQAARRLKKTKSEADPTDEATIRKDAEEVATKVNKTFPNLVCTAIIENEFYRPPFAVSWKVEEKKKRK